MHNAWSQTTAMKHCEIGTYERKCYNVWGGSEKKRYTHQICEVFLINTNKFILNDFVLAVSHSLSISLEDYIIDLSIHFGISGTTFGSGRFTKRREPNLNLLSTLFIVSIITSFHQRIWSSFDYNGLVTIMIKNLIIITEERLELLGIECTFSYQIKSYQIIKLWHFVMWHEPFIRSNQQ